MRVDEHQEPLQQATFRCAVCRGVFTKAWSDEEARQAQDANGWGGISDWEIDTVCDDCYQVYAARIAEAEKELAWHVQ